MYYTINKAKPPFNQNQHKIRGRKRQEATIYGKSGHLLPLFKPFLPLVELLHGEAEPIHNR